MVPALGIVAAIALAAHFLVVVLACCAMLAVLALALAAWRVRQATVAMPFAPARRIAPAAPPRTAPAQVTGARERGRR